MMPFAFFLQKCAINLCPQVSKTEDVDSCQYKEKCRFNHDIEAFKAQVLFFFWLIETSLVDIEK